MMDTKKLRQKVLDLAIRGKLVPQDPNDEPASMLLERIRDEKERLIKEGKIKRDKKEKTSDTSHYEKSINSEGVPFEIPESWEWCRLNDVCSQITDGTHRTPSYTEDGVPFLRVTDITESNASKKFISEDEHKELIKRCHPEKGDVLLSKNGTIGVSKVVDWDYDFSVFVSLCLLKPLRIILDSQYLVFFLSSNEAMKQMKSRGKAFTITNLHLEEIKQLQILIPPFAEQHRITKKIEECFALIDQVEENKLSLSQFIKQAKSNVLDLAIRGKLVPQDPNESITNYELKITKIASDILNYKEQRQETPDNWMITTMQDICCLSDGEKISDKILPYLDVKYLRGKSEAKMLTSGIFVPKNSTLILVDGENSGEIFSVKEDGYQGSTLKILHINNFVDRNFIFKILQKEQSTFRESKVGSAIPHLNKKLFRELVIYLPPLSEQKRIVQKIEFIFQTLDSIQNNL